MPCQSEYINPSALEVLASKAYCCLDELDGLEVSPSDWLGYHPRAYGCNPRIDQVDNATALACARISDKDPTQYSLELQIWWRDHQRADRNRRKAEELKATLVAEKQAVLSKLTAREREILGL
jgi:hypothetical protein